MIRRLTIETRVAGLADIPELAVLFDAYRQFYEQPSDLALARHFLIERMRRDESVVLVAEATGSHADSAEGVLLGFCQMYPTFCSVEARPIYSLYDLFVAPPGRRSGVGLQLLQAAEAHGRQQGMSRLDLTTARTNLAAQSLYEKCGWVRDEVFFAYNRSLVQASPA